MLSHSDFQISALIANSLKAKMLFVKGTKHCQGLVHAPPPVETKMSLWNWMVHCQGLVLPSKQTPHVTVRDWRRTGNILMLARSPPKKEDAGMLPAMLGQAVHCAYHWPVLVAHATLRKPLNF